MRRQMTAMPLLLLSALTSEINNKLVIKNIIDLKLKDFKRLCLWPTTCFIEIIRFLTLSFRFYKFKLQQINFEADKVAVFNFQMNLCHFDASKKMKLKPKQQC